MEETTQRMEKLTADTYHSWKFNMKMTLIGKDLWDLVQGFEELPEDATQKQHDLFRKRNNSSLSLICLNVSPELHIYVRNCETGYEAWKSLADHFEEKTLSKKISLRRKLYEIKLEKGSQTTMEAHVNNIKTVSEHLEALDDPVAEKDLVMILLSSIGSDYHNLVVALETLKEEQLTWTYVRDRLMSEYERRRDEARTLPAVHDAFVAGHGTTDRNGGGRNNRNFNNNLRNGQQQPPNHQQQQLPQQQQPQQHIQHQQSQQQQNQNNYQRFNLKCHHCRKPGHLRRDCPEYLGGGVATGFNATTNSLGLGAGLTNPTFSPEFALKVTESSATDDDWWIDSGASSHMTEEMDDFVSYTEFDDPVEVNLADNSSLLAPGYGDVAVRIYDVNAPENRVIDMLLKNTLYVPEIQNKLFSIPAVTENEGSVIMKKESCLLEMNGKSVEIGSKCGKLYKLNSTPIQQSCLLGVRGKPLSLWHLRYGHLNVADVKLLHDKKLVSGMHLSSVDEVTGCHGCALGKSKRSPFPKKSEHKSTHPLQLVHSDVCGPMHVTSLGGSRYFVTFIDDFSRFVTAYIMKSKDEAFDKFVEFVIAAENRFGIKIKDFKLEGELGVRLQKFRSDGGGEFVSKKFQEFCITRGIDKQLTVPYTPQQNGVAERMNRTLMEMARSMMYHANIPQKLWAEAVSTAVYLRNRCPTSSFPGATPYERWFGEKPDVDHLRIFGCSVYVHVPDEKRQKLDPKAFKGVFVGYPSGTKGYKIFEPKSEKMFRSRDVSFLEDSFNSILLSTTENEDPLSMNIPPLPTKPSDAEKTAETAAESVIFNFNNVSDEFEEESAEEDDADPVADRIQRIRRPPNRFGEWATIAAVSTNGDPRTFKQAMKSEQSTKWSEAMLKEISSLKDYQTWDLVDLPAGANLLKCKWVFKTKRKPDGEIDRYKARLVAQGYSQEAGVDYEETFAPVAKYKSIRTVLAIGNQLDLEIHQMDVNSAYLNGDLAEDIYMQQPQGFEDPHHPNKVCKLRKSLYGLKQSARCWNDKIDGYLKSQGYMQNTADPCIYYRSDLIDGKVVIMIIAVYVDDTVVMSNSLEILNREKAMISERFSMDDRGEIHHILGMEVRRDRINKTLTINQQSYLKDVLARFGMEKCNPVSTPLETGKKFSKLSEGEETVDVKQYQAAIGSLNYAAIATRPDLSVAVGMLSQFMVNPGCDHWSGVKRVLRYVKGTLNYGLRFTVAENFTLYGYSDADWAGCHETRKSTSGQVFRIGNCTVSWRSKKQSVVALSSTESEYIALSESAQEAVWMRDLLKGVGLTQELPTVLYEDNQGAIALARNPKDHSRTKHIDIRFHYTRQQINNNTLEVRDCSTTDMLADTLTKGLPKPAFQKFRERMGIYPC